jgi:hypothetical protein
MLYQDPYMAEEVMEMQVKDRLHQAEVRRLLRQIRGDRRAWLRRHVARLLYELGNLLVIGSRRPDRHASGS